MCHLILGVIAAVPGGSTVGRAEMTADVRADVRVVAAADGERSRMVITRRMVITVLTGRVRPRNTMVAVAVLVELSNILEKQPGWCHENGHSTRVQNKVDVLRCNS